MYSSSFEALVAFLKSILKTLAVCGITALIAWIILFK